MKKKGLIISTVVMVVVLIASLTTATYAWFTASTKTEIKGFNVSVVSANAVNIGMKKQYGFSNAPTPIEFATGSVAFAVGTDDESGLGKIKNPGSWTSNSNNDGFSATLEHNINWGSQSQAVGVTTAPGVTAENVQQETTLDNTKFWVNHTGENTNIVYGTDNNNKTAVIAANKAPGSDALTDQKLARANVGESEGTAGDYVHFILGVSPTKALERNNFIIMISPSSDTSTLGVLASIHVAYRIKVEGQNATAWTEVDLYKSNHGTTKVADVSNAGVSEAVNSAHRKTYNAAASTGSAACVIEGLDTEVNKISQVEVVIYMAGADSDCNDSGKTASGDVKMFFDTVDATTTQADTATIDSNQILKITGGDYSYTPSNTTVKIGERVIAGSWSQGTFTSTEAVSDVTAGTTKVTIQTTDKLPKELTIQNANAG